MNIKLLQNKICVKNGKKLSIILLLFALVLGAKANPVDMQLAREVGVKFVSANTRMNVLRGEDLEHVTTYRTAEGAAAFYVFNAGDGFVIVAADDCTTPILGYSDEGRPFDPDNVPIQMQEYLQAFVEQIRYGIENHLEANEATAQQWAMVIQDGRLSNDRSVTSVEPLLTTRWNQDCYYNALCPESANGPCGHAYTGCVATAMAQILNFWGYPYRGHGSHSYTPNYYPEQTVNFGATFYDWANMPDELTPNSTQTEINAVSTLLYHCGVAVDMSYGSNASSANNNKVIAALLDYFNFAEDAHKKIINYSQYYQQEWTDTIKASLDQGRPVYYAGFNPPNPLYPGQPQTGHAWVCDGYDANNMLHFNWGWGGYCDGYFLTPSGENHNFIYDNYIILDIHPKCNTETYHQIITNSYPEMGGTVTGTGSYQCTDICTMTATANMGYTFLYWTENDSIFSHSPSVSIVVTEARNFTAHFGVNFTVGTDPEPYGGYSIEGASHVPNGPSVYTRITDVGELMPGDRVIFAARYNDVANQYVAMKNELEADNFGRFSTTLFTSQNNGDNEFLSADIVNQEYDYYWTLGITDEGYYTFTNTAGQVLNGYDYWFFNMNGNNCNWTIASEIAGLNAMVPNYEGFVISGINTDCGFALEGGDGLYYCRNGALGYNNESEYNFYFDIFRQPVEVYTAPYNSNVTLMAVPNEHKSFVSWTKDNVEVSTDVLYSFSNTDNADYVAHFVGDPLVTFTVNPIGSGIIPHHVTDLSELGVGDRIILVARYDTMPSHYAAIQNNCDGGILPCTLYTSNGTEDISFDILNDLDNYYWTIGITPEGCFTFTNANGQILSAHWRQNVFIMDGSYNTWNMGTGFAGSDALVPNCSGVTIVNTRWDYKGFALYEYYDGYCVGYTGFDTNYEGTNCIFEIFKISPSGSIFYPYNSNVSLVAMANEGYSFINWTVNGDVVSTQPTYSFTGTEDVDLVANFVSSVYAGITAIANPEAGGTVIGAGTYNLFETCTLTATANEGYTFVNWTKNGIVVSTNPTCSFTVMEDATFVANFTQSQSDITQTINLSIGWNWLSTYLDITLEDLQNALVEALPGATSITIKSKNGNCRWNGTIWRAANGFVWDVAKMYMIVVPESCELTLNGTPFNPAEHPITIAPNTSTWIGFPFSESKTFNEAIPAGFAVSGDQIKYQNATARFNGTTWRGSTGFTGLEPGKGYMYNSVSSSERTLIFPTGAK